MLTAGVAQLDITPPLGTSMRGYFEKRSASQVHDPLYVRSFALDNGDCGLAIAICDIIGLDRKYQDRAKAMVAETTALAPEQVLIACTHTHTGPETGDDPYTDFLTKRIADAVQLSWDRRAAARAGWGSEQESRAVFNRRYRMADGTVHTNPGVGNANVVEPAGPVDPEVGVLALQRPDGSPLGLLANYALHYVGIPDDFHALSADYFGYFSRLIQGMVGQSFVAALSNGASGDINNWDVMGNVRPQNDHYQHTERVAGLVAASALYGANGAVFSDDLPLGAAMAQVTLNPRPAPTAEEVQAAEEIFRREEANEPVLMGERSFARRVRRLAENPPQGRETWVQAMRIGDLGIAGVPGEYFCELGLRIKERSPFAQTMVIELANDSVGYIATERAYEEGAYEPNSSSYEPGFGEQIADRAVELLEQLRG